MITNRIGNPNAEILLIGSKTDLKLSDCQYFHNLITHRPNSTQKLYENDFYIILGENLKAEEIDISNHNIIITVADKKLNDEIRSYPLDPNIEIKWVIVDEKNRQQNEEVEKLFFNVENLHSDEKLIKLIDEIKYQIYWRNEEGMEEQSIFSMKNIIYYQWICFSCDKHNLIILNKSETKPNKCNHCSYSIIDIKNNLNTEILIFNNYNMKALSSKYKFSI